MKSSNSLKSILRVILPATIVLSNTALADFQYSYVEASYIKDQTSFETTAVDETESNGYDLSLGFALSRNIAIGGSFTSLEGDSIANFQEGGRADINIAGTAMSATALYHAALNDQTDTLKLISKRLGQTV